MVSLECDTSVFLFPLLPNCFRLTCPSACSPHRIFARRQHRKRFRFDAFPCLRPHTPKLSYIGSSLSIPFSWVNPSPPITPEFKRRSRCTVRHATFPIRPSVKGTPHQWMHVCPTGNSCSQMHPCSGVILTSSTCRRNHQAPSQSGARLLFGAVLIHIVLTMIVLGILGTVRLSSVTIVVSHSRTPWARRFGEASRSPD